MTIADRIVPGKRAMSTVLTESTNILPDGLLYIDGSLRAAEAGRTYDNVGPWTGRVVSRAADASAADVEADQSDWLARIE